MAFWTISTNFVKIEKRGLTNGLNRAFVGYKLANKNTVLFKSKNNKGE